ALLPPATIVAQSSPSVLEGVRARLRRVAGCATPSGSAGHAGETANLKLTFHPDHSVGANHERATTSSAQKRASRPCSMGQPWNVRYSQNCSNAAVALN